MGIYTGAHAQRAWKLALLDIDGTLTVGSQPIAGASAFVTRLRSRGIQPVFFTNNATRTPDAVCGMLRTAGVWCDAGEVCTAAEAAADWVIRDCGAGVAVATIGMEGLRTALSEAGLRLVDPGNHAHAADVAVRAAVLGLDKTVTYATLAWFCRQVERVGSYILTNGDKRLPDEGGMLPGNGALGAFVTTATGIDPVIAGKPNAAFVYYALSRFGVSIEDTFLVGDNPATDVQAARNARVYCIQVQTGVGAAQSRASSAVPERETLKAGDRETVADEVVSSIAELFLD